MDAKTRVLLRAECEGWDRDSLFSSIEPQPTIGVILDLLDRADEYDWLKGPMDTHKGPCGEQNLLRDLADDLGVPKDDNSWMGLFQAVTRLKREVAGAWRNFPVTDPRAYAEMNLEEVIKEALGDLRSEVERQKGLVLKQSRHHIESVKEWSEEAVRLTRERDEARASEADAHTDADAATLQAGVEAARAEQLKRERDL